MADDPLPPNAAVWFEIPVTDMARVKAAGGEVVSPAITIEAGRFAYCLDPDGNSFSVFAR